MSDEIEGSDFSSWLRKRILRTISLTSQRQFGPFKIRNLLTSHTYYTSFGTNINM